MALILWLTAFVTTVTLLITFYNSLLRSNNRKFLNKKLPPEADGGWPFIGHMPLFSGTDLPHIILANMADKYGPIFSLRLGVHRVLIASSWEIAKECFTVNDIIFSNRPKTAAVQHMTYNFAMLGFSKYGPYWREMRKTTMMRLLSNNNVAMLGNLFESEVRAMMRSLYSSCLKSSNEKVPLEMKKVFGDLTRSLMVRIVAGDRENKKTNNGVGGNEMWGEAINEFFKMMGVVTIPDALPFFKWLDYFGGTHNKGFKKTGKKMDSMLQAWLDDHKKRKITCGDSEKIEGFMAEMMVEADRIAKEFSEYDADTIVKATCLTMMLGGTDTTTVTITWAVSLLLNHPHTIKKAQQELNIHVGPERQVKASDIENLIYIKAILKETLRLYPPAPLGPPRETAEDCTVAGYHVAGGTRLILNIWKLHRDPRVWSDPHEFKPERFLTGQHDEVDVRGQNFELLPFGGGRRVCVGVSFALQVAELALASFLHSFDMETPGGEGVDMTGSLGSLGATFMKVAPLEVLLTPRLSPHLNA